MGHCFNLVDMGSGPCPGLPPYPRVSGVASGPDAGPQAHEVESPRLGLQPTRRAGLGPGQPNHPPAGGWRRAPWGSLGCAPVRARVPRGATAVSAPPAAGARGPASPPPGAPAGRTPPPAVAPGPSVAGRAAGARRVPGRPGIASAGRAGGRERPGGGHRGRGAARRRPRSAGRPQENRAGPVDVREGLGLGLKSMVRVPLGGCRKHHCRNPRRVRDRNPNQRK